MLTGQDVGKRTIIFDTFKNKWEPCKHTLAAIDTALGYGYLERENHQSWRWPLKYIRVINNGY